MQIRRREEVRGEIIKQLRTNRRIRAREVLVIDEAGERLGVMPLAQALGIAEERDLDLVEVAATAVPPVCRLLDYGKYKYEQSKKEREAKKGQRISMVREVRLRPKIDTHDLESKIRLAGKLLKGGDKVKVAVFFRGREITHPEIGWNLLQRISASLSEQASVERMPAMEGRNMNIILIPSPAKQSKEPRKED